MRIVRHSKIATALLLVTAALLTACGDNREESAGQAALREFPTPEGRILTANQAANTVSVIDVATNLVYRNIGTGQQPHHVVAAPNAREFWVTLYGENRLQVFDANSMEEIASVDVGAANDDLTFDPDGKRVYVSLGNDNAVAVVDAAARKPVQKVPVGKSPHGVKVTEDGKYLLVTNTADNTLSVLSLGEEVRVESTIRTGPNPFEVMASSDGSTAYVSNFLGDSISVVDLTAGRTIGYIRSGKQPAMLAIQDSADGQRQLWVANTGSSEVWLIDADTQKLVTRVPVGKGAHGVVVTPSGKIYVTNSNDNTVSVIDQAEAKVLTTVAVGNNPNGLTFLPNAAGE